MVIAALFTIAKTCKQPKYPLTDEWIKKMWYIYTMDYYSAIKRNEIMLFITTWMYLEIVIQSEVSQRKTSIIYECICMKSRKMVLMNVFTQKKWRHRGREQFDGHSKAKRG